MTIMRLTRKAFQDWGRIGGRTKAARLLKAKLRQKVKAPKKRPVGRPKGSGKLGRKIGGKNRASPKDADKLARAQDMVRLSQTGHTLQEIGDAHGVTRERARQILNTMDAKPANGGASLRGAFRKKDVEEKKRARKAARIGTLLGCSVEQLVEINGHSFIRKPKSPSISYLNQKRQAKQRGIEFNFTFLEWWRFWQNSGKWGKRGGGKGYCMARFGDSGAYEVGNVEIITIGQNFKDSFLTKPAKERAIKGMATRERNGKQARGRSTRDHQLLKNA